MQLWYNQIMAVQLNLFGEEVKPKGIAKRKVFNSLTVRLLTFLKLSATLNNVGKFNRLGVVRRKLQAKIENLAAGLSIWIVLNS